MLPRIALTMGDVAGIGPEVVARALSDEALRRQCTPVVIGHPEVLRRALQMAGVDLTVESVGPDVSAASGRRTVPLAQSVLPCWNPGSDDVTAVPAGHNDHRAGRAAYDYLVAAARAAIAGQIDGIVTAPLSKAALRLAGL